MKYRYYSIMRPIFLGTYPSNAEVAEVRNFDERIEVPEIGRKAWGYIEFSQKLNEADVNQYELVYDKAYEDKHELVGLLYKVIKQSRAGSNLKDLFYKDDEENDLETVTALFQNGGKQVANVSGDSGIAMIRDIMKQIDF